MKLLLLAVYALIFAAWGYYCGFVDARLYGKQPWSRHGYEVMDRHYPLPALRDQNGTFWVYVGDRRSFNVTVTDSAKGK